MNMVEIYYLSTQNTFIVVTRMETSLNSTQWKWMLLNTFVAHELYCLLDSLKSLYL